MAWVCTCVKILLNVFTRLLLTALIASTAQAAVPLLDHSLSMKMPLKVFIDVGHGGKDRGAKGLFGIQESELCLKIGQLVGTELRAKWARESDRPLEIHASREHDDYLSLKERVETANTWGADLFLSIHANSLPVALAHGFEVYFLSPEASDEAAKKLAVSENAGEGQSSVSSQVLSILLDAQTTNHIQESSDFADVIFQALSVKFTPNGRGVRQAPFTVLAGTEMPAVLIEVGYVNHVVDASNLSKQNYLKALAGAISTGIIRFVGKHKPDVS
jgi:N-acetylmuramoyl-L-alanine amidase